MAVHRSPSLILTAHGSADPRSSATTRRIADEIRRQRPGLDVRVAFCERSEPNLRDVLAGLAGDGPLQARELYRGAPYGVGYFVGVWQP